MSSSRPKRIVINSFRFFIDICPAVLRELEFENSFAELESDETSLGLYEAIKRGNHKILITRGIEREYSQGASRYFPQVEWIPVVRRLTSDGLIIRPRLPGGVRNHPGLPSFHRNFLIDSIDAKADYFVTERELWISQANTISNEYGLAILRPDDFIHLENI